MPTSVARLFTPTEAGAISGLGVKGVHNAIDKRIVEPVMATAAVGGKTKAAPKLRKRFLTPEDLVSLRLWGGMKALPAETRRVVYREIRNNPAAKRVRADKFLIVDVEAARKEVAEGMKVFKEALRAIHSDPEVMGGEPVFKGTRIPVYAVAEMLKAAASEGELLSGYPKLDSRKLELARVWAKAHPRRGRPKRLSDHGLSPKATSRRSLSSTNPKRALAPSA